MNEIYGTLKSGAPMKKGYHLPRAQMENADIARIINSTEVQSVLRPKLEAPKKFAMKKNALKNKQEMAKLNPCSEEDRALRRKQREQGSAEQKSVADGKKARVQASKDHNKKHKKGDETFYKTLMKAFEAKNKEEKDEEEAGDDECAPRDLDSND